MSRPKMPCPCQPRNTHTQQQKRNVCLCLKRCLSCVCYAAFWQHAGKFEPEAQGKVGGCRVHERIRLHVFLPFLSFLLLPSCFVMPACCTERRRFQTSHGREKERGVLPCPGRKVPVHQMSLSQQCLMQPCMHVPNENLSHNQSVPNGQERRSTATRWEPSHSSK